MTKTSAPIPADPGIHNMTERDIARIEQLALDRPAVLNAVCKLMNVYLETSQYTLGQDHWTAKPADGYPFSGTLVQVGAFVRGYAIAWHSGRDRQRRLVEQARRFLSEQIEELQ